MHLQNKNILLISPESWNHIFVSKHHYALYLAARGNKVYFLNPPSEKEGLATTDYRNLSILDYRGFPKGLRLFPRFLQKYFIAKQFSKLQSLIDDKFDIVWSFDNSVFYDFSALPSQVLSISHIVDLNQNFQTARAASTAHICLCVADKILERSKLYNPESHKIQHGVDLTKTFSNVNLPGANAKKAIYAGNLSMPYIDWNLLEKSVTDNPCIDFVFLGPNDDHPKQNTNLQKLSNCFFLGRVSANELQNYYASADILLLSYQQKYQQDQVTNSHKMMEYLASGKVIVSTFTAEYKMLAEQELIAMSSGRENFLPLLKQVSESLPIWNGVEKSDQRISYALQNTYPLQIERIEKLLEKYVGRMSE